MSYRDARSDLLEVAQATVAKARATGADQAEVFCSRSQEARVQLEADDVSTARSDEEEGYGIRVRVAGATGFAATNDASPESLDEAVAAAIALARVSPPDPHDDLAPRDEPIEVDGLYDAAVGQVEVDDVARRAGELAAAVKERDARVRLDSGWISLSTHDTALATSVGTTLSERQTSAQGLLMGMAVDGDRVGSFDHEVVQSCALPDFEREVAGMPERFVAKVVACLDARPGESFSGSLVLSPEAVAEFLLPNLVAALSAQAVRTGKSRLRDRLNESIASESLGVMDDATLAGRPGSGAFDREGIAPRPLPLVERGVLRSFLYNTREARAAGRERSTGHASGGSRTPPGIGPSNLIVEAGSDTDAALIGDVERGILLHRFSGNSDPVSGDFSGVAKGSFLIANGDASQAIQETLISGNLFELLDSISGVGRERRWIDGSVLAPILRL